MDQHAAPLAISTHCKRLLLHCGAPLPKAYILKGMCIHLPEACSPACPAFRQACISLPMPRAAHTLAVWSWRQPQFAGQKVRVVLILI